MRCSTRCAANSQIALVVAATSHTRVTRRPNPQGDVRARGGTPRHSFHAVVASPEGEGWLTGKPDGTHHGHGQLRRIRRPAAAPSPGAAAGGGVMAPAAVGRGGTV